LKVRASVLLSSMQKEAMAILKAWLCHTWVLSHLMEPTLYGVLIKSRLVWRDPCRCAYLKGSSRFHFSFRKFQIIGTQLEFGILLCSSGVSEPSQKLAGSLG
jgi:hypothetical protein